MPYMDIKPVTLTGKHTRLEPLSLAHVDDLVPHAIDPGIWSFMPYGAIDTPERVRWWVQEMLRRQAAGNDLPFATIDMASGKAVGATRFMDIRRADRAVEIGGSWLGQAYRRTAINTEAKYLQLTHAFETWGCIRAQIKADLRNERSQRAIERLGATREGVIRKNMIMPDGYQRSSVYYSILDDEWSAVKTRLQTLLGQAAA